MAVRKLVLLRVLLMAAALGWGVSFVGIFLPWAMLAQVFRSLGAGDVPNDAMVAYWVRATAATFGFLGVLFAVAAVRPERYINMIFWLAVLMLGVGAASLFFGLLLGIPTLPFLGDVAFCLVIGTGLLLLRDGRRAD